jgi:hypothetical protein
MEIKTGRTYIVFEAERNIFIRELAGEAEEFTGPWTSVRCGPRAQKEKCGGSGYVLDTSLFITRKMNIGGRKYIISVPLSHARQVTCRYRSGLQAIAYLELSP